MRKIALVAAVSLLIESLCLAADPSCALLGQWGSRGVTADIAIDGSRAWVADGRGIAVYDASNEALPRLLNKAETTTPSRAIILTSGRVVVLTAAGIETFIRGGGTSLQPGVGREEPGIRALAANDNFIAAAGMQLELLVPGTESLNVVRAVPISGAVQSLRFSGNLLLAGVAGQGLFIYDTSGGNLDLIGEAPVEAMAIATSASLVYAAGGGNGLSVVDVSDPTQPVVLTRVLSGQSNLTGITRSGTTLYAIDASTSKVDVFNITSGAAPALVQKINEPARAIAADGARLFTSGLITYGNRSTTSSGSPLRIYDLADPLQPVFEGEFLDYAGPLTGAATDGSFAYVADPPLFRVIDIRNPAQPREVASLPMYDAADRIYLRGSRVLAYGRANVHIIDVADPFHPRELGVYLSQGNVPDAAAMAGQYLVEDNRASGFHVVDISDPSRPTFLSGLKNDPQNGQFFGLVAVDGAAYGFTPNSLKVIDLSEPRANRLDHVIPALKIADAAIAPASETHSQLLLLIDADRVRIFDLSDIIHPAEIADLAIPHLLDIAAVADVAYGITAERELVRFDISDPRNPRITNVASGLSNPVQVSFAGDRVVVADSYSLQVFRDLQSAAAPIEQTITLNLVNQTARAVTVEWSGTPGASYEVETSTDPLFAQTETLTTSATRSGLMAAPGSYVRVRATNGCTVSEWSNVLTIRSPATSGIGSLLFAESGRTIVAGPADESITISVPVVNVSAVAASANLLVPTTSGGEISAGSPAVIQPGQTQLIDVTFAGGSLRTSKTISLQLANSPGRYDVRIVDALASPADRSPLDDEAVLAGVAATPGSNGTVWKSDLNLLCRSTASCDVQVTYRAYGAASSPTAFNLSLDSGESVVINDVVKRIFGKNPSVGALEISASDLNGVLASAVTYNEGPTGRFGQRVVSAHVSTDASQSVRKRRLLGVLQDDRFRTNIGLANATDTASMVTMQALNASGEVLAVASRALDAREGIQISFSDYFPNVGPFSGGSIAVTAPNGVVVYASRVDQSTGDATYSLAAAAEPPDDQNALPRYVRQLAVATSTPGANGTLWKTALQIVNEGLAIDDFILTFIPSADPSQTRRRSVTLASQASLSTEDLFGEVLMNAPGSPSPYGTLRIDSASPFSGWGRLYTTGPAGTYGQFVPLSSAAPARAVPGRATVSPYAKTGFSDVLNALQIFPVSDNASERTNFGIVEVHGKPGAVTLKFFDPAGQFVGAMSRSIAAFGSQPLFNVLSDLGLSGISGLRVEIEQEGEGLVKVYASVVERSTGDAVFIPAQ